MKKIAVLGAGAWGTAVAKVICDSGKEVALWCRNSLEADRMVRECPSLQNIKFIRDGEQLDKNPESEVGTKCSPPLVPMRW